MTPTEFIAKWRANTRNERAASQEHFLDLCALVSEPTPNSDPTRAAYAFEKGATKASGGDCWADVCGGCCPGMQRASARTWRPRTGNACNMPAGWKIRRCLALNVPSSLTRAISLCPEGVGVSGTAATGSTNSLSDHRPDETGRGNRHDDNAP